jgi:hypothetical protein
MLIKYPLENTLNRGWLKPAIALAKSIGLNHYGNKKGGETCPPGHLRKKNADAAKFCKNIQKKAANFSRFHVQFVKTTEIRG